VNNSNQTSKELKELKIQKNNEILLNKIKKEVNEKLWENEPNELVGILWNNFNKFNGSYGHFSKQHHYGEGDFREEIVEYFDENQLLEEFQDYYFEWFSHTQHELMKENEEIKSIKDEEERYETSYEWVDSDGFTFGGFQNYMYFLTNQVIDELMEEEIENYSKMLVENGFDGNWNWNTNGYVNGSSIELFNQYEWTDINDVIEYNIYLEFNEKEFTITHINDWYDSSNGSNEYIFNNFNEFVSKLNGLKSELDKKEYQTKIEDYTNNDIQKSVEHLIQRVEEKGYTVQKDSSGCPFKTIDDDLSSHEVELFIYDENNEGDQVSLYYWEILDLDEGEWIGYDCDEELGCSDIQDDFNFIEHNLKTLNDVDDFLKKRLKKFELNKDGVDNLKTIN